MSIGWWNWTTGRRAGCGPRGLPRPSRPGERLFGTASADQLHWTDDGRILFPWERDGYRHFHAVSAAGGEPAALTAGRFEIEYAVPDGEGACCWRRTRTMWTAAISGASPPAAPPRR